MSRERVQVTKLAFVDVGVECEVAAIAKHIRYFANGETQAQQLDDALLVLVELAFLDDPFRLAFVSLAAFCPRVLLWSQTDEVAFQLGKQGEEGDSDFRVHVVGIEIEVLLEDNGADGASDQSIDEGDHICGTAAQAREFCDDEGIRIGEGCEYLVNAALFAGLTGRDGDFHKSVNFEVAFVGVLQDFEFLVVQVLFVG